MGRCRDCMGEKGLTHLRHSCEQGELVLGLVGRVVVSLFVPISIPVPVPMPIPVPVPVSVPSS